MSWKILKGIKKKLSLQLRLFPVYQGKLNKLKGVQCIQPIMFLHFKHRN